MLHSMGSQSQTWLSDWTTTTSFPVLHHSLEFASIHVHWISDVISPSHPLPPPSPPALNLSQHQGLFQWVGPSHQVTKVLELQLQHQPFWWIFRVSSLRIDWFDLFAVQGTLKGLLQHYSSKASNSSALSLLNGPALISTDDYRKDNSFDYMDLCQQSDISAF